MVHRAVIVIMATIPLLPTKLRLLAMTWKSCVPCCMKKVCVVNTCAANDAPFVIYTNVQAAARNILALANIRKPSRVAAVISNTILNSGCFYCPCFLKHDSPQIFVHLFNRAEVPQPGYTEK